MPCGDDPRAEPALWHVLHDDGDEEDLEEGEMAAALGAHAEGRSEPHGWQSSGHPWIGQRVRRFFDYQVGDGTVAGWLPASATETACRTRIERAPQAAAATLGSKASQHRGCPRLL